MAYTKPHRFAHGDFPLAANMQIYSDDLDYLNSLAGVFNYAVQDLDGGNARMFRLWRWLWYQTESGSGEITDPSNIGEDYTLPESDDEMTAFDLDKVEWLTPGRKYQIEGCKYAMEDFNLEVVSSSTQAATGSFTQTSNQDAVQTADLTEARQRAWFGL